MLRIVTVEKEDVEAISEIENASFTEDTWSYESLLKAVDDKNTLFVVAKDEDLVLGYALLYVSFEDAEIATIAVNSDYRGRGIGGALIEEVCDWLTLHFIEEIFLEVRESNADAIRLYESCDFEQISVRKGFYKDPVEDALVYSKKLQNDDEIVITTSSIDSMRDSLYKI